MKAATKLTSKGQVVIPKRVRDRLRWRAGTRLEVTELPEGGVRLAVVEENFETLLDRLSGCLRGHDVLTALETDRRAEREREGRWPQRLGEDTRKRPAARRKK